METSKSLMKKEESCLIILHCVTHKMDANLSIRLQSLDRLPLLSSQEG